MLPAANRLRSADDFRRTVRRGTRAGGALLVVHLTERGEEPLTVPGRSGPTRGAVASGPRIGFVVARSVGPAVTRNRVKRRLRHLLRERLDSLPGFGVLVVRAQPAAARASYADLGAELDRLLERVRAKTADATAQAPAPRTAP